MSYIALVEIRELKDCTCHVYSSDCFSRRPLTLRTKYIPILAGVLVCSFNPLLTTSAICNAVLPLLDENGCLPCSFFFLKGQCDAWPMVMSFIVSTLSVQVVVSQGPWYIYINKS